MYVYRNVQNSEGLNLHAVDVCMANQGFNITWLIAGYRSGWRAWVFGLGNAWFVSAFSETVAVVLAMVMPSFPAAIGTFSGPFTVLCIPLCGLLIPTHKVPVPLRYLAYGNPLRYAAGAEILNQFANRTLIMVRLCEVAFVSCR